MRLPISQPALHGAPLIGQVDIIALPSIFRVREILDEIAEFTPITSLLDFALCCRTTSNAAMRVRWKVLSSPIPLFKLSDAVHFTGEEWCLSGVIPTNWEKYDQYSCHVRRIYSMFASDPTGVADIDHNIFFFLHQCRPGTPLFPALSSVSLPSKPLLPTILPFISPRLQQIRLHIQRNKSYVQELLSVAPNILAMHISGHISSSDIDSLTNFDKLRKLTLRITSKVPPDLHSRQREAFRDLQLSPRIISLAFNAPARFQTPFLPIASTTSLKSLQILGPVQSITANLKLTSNLESVFLQFSGGESVPTEDLKSCFEALRASSQHTIRSINISCNGLSQLSDSIVPLLAIPNILVFQVTYGDVADLDFSDDDVNEITSAWPNLVTFMLPDNAPGCYQLTFRSLEVLSTLPSIRNIRMPIGNDIAFVPFDRCRYKKSPLNAHIEELFSPSQLRL